MEIHGTLEEAQRARQIGEVIYADAYGWGFVCLPATDTPPTWWWRVDEVLEGLLPEVAA